jgi:hypothetical protein
MVEIHRFEKTLMPKIRPSNASKHWKPGENR